MAWDTEHASPPLPCPGTLRGRAWTSLPARRDFLRLTAAKRRTTPGFILQYAPRDVSSASLRVGFTASRKVGNAVARNRCKRRLRALVDNVIAGAADPALDYVLIARSEALVRDFAVMENELREALKKIADGKLLGAKP